MYILLQSGLLDRIRPITATIKLLHAAVLPKCRRRRPRPVPRCHSAHLTFETLRPGLSSRLITTLQTTPPTRGMQHARQDACQTKRLATLHKPPTRPGPHRCGQVIAGVKGSGSNHSGLHRLGVVCS